jgi:phage host-nuclease inhibitor protein Gam
MNKKVTRIKAVAAPAAQSREDAESLLAEIGHAQRRVTEIEAVMNDRLSAIKAEFEQQAAPFNDAIKAKFASLQVWAEANRDELLTGRSKTARLTTGELSWRTTPPSVRIAGAEVVMENLKRLGLGDLIRTKEEINKEAILAEPERVEGVKGITISQREEFVAKPFESQIERAEPVMKKAA